jgi:hypothetical protein
MLSHSIEIPCRNPHRHGGGGDSNGNSSRGHSNDCRGAPTTALGVGAEGIAFATAWEGLWVLVVRVVCGVVHAGCVCAARPCCFGRGSCKKGIKNLANHGILGIAGKLLTRRAKLLHLIKANLYNLRSYGQILLTCSNTLLKGTC